MASIQLPGWKPQERKEQKKDPLDMIQQGLQIAASAYGIYSDSQKLDIARQTQLAEGDSRKLSQLKMQQDIDKAAADQYLSDKERVELLKNGLSPTEPDTPGALKFATKSGGTEWWKPAQKAEKVEYRDVELFDPKAGQNVIVSVPKNQAVPGGYLAPRKDNGEPKTFEVAGVGPVKDKKTADDLSQAMERYGNLKAGIGKMLNVRERAGTGGFEVLDRSLVKEGTQASQDVKFQYKDLAKLGVLSDQDAIALANIVPDDPTGWGSSVNKQMVELGKLTDTKMANGLYQKGIPPEKIVAITGELPTLITQGMTPAQQIALKELLIEKNQMGSR